MRAFVCHVPTYVSDSSLTGTSETLSTFQSHIPTRFTFRNQLFWALTTHFHLIQLVIGSVVCKIPLETKLSEEFHVNIWRSFLKTHWETFLLMNGRFRLAQLFLDVNSL